MFSNQKYSHYFEFVFAKDENIKVCCTFGVAAQLNLQSKSHQVVLSRGRQAKPRPRFLQKVPHHPNNKAGLRCKTNKWGRVEEVGLAVCCWGNTTGKHGWLALMRCHNKQDQCCAWRYHWKCTSNKMSIGETGCHLYVETAGVLSAAAECN